MPAPEVIHQLVKRFDEHLDAYRSGRYNETQLRREFEPTERAVDQLVYSLYELTEEEIKIVEG